MIELELYRKGFVIYPENMNGFTKPYGYITKKINNFFYISYDEKYPVSIFERDGLFCLLIGVAIDTKVFRQDHEYISDTILNLISGEDSDIFSNSEFLDYLDYLNGRYCIVFIQDDNLYVTNDASGMRSVFYHDSLNVIASHYNLLNDLTKEEEHPLIDVYRIQRERYDEARFFSPFGLPGNITMYQHIYQLVCNHFYDLKSHKLIRFWPRHKDYNFDLDEAVSYISDTITKSLSILVDNYDVYQSLTMGNDSRMSLAAAKDYTDKITFFTYDSLRYPEADAQYNCRFSSEVARLLNLKYHFVDCTSDLTAQESELLKKNHYRQHKKGIISGFRKTFMNIDPYKAMHVRTNITELLRKSYYTISKNASPEELAEKMAHWSSYPPKYAEEFNAVKQYYSEYIKETDFTNVQCFDYGDIFYLEYRMNQWHSAVVQNQDFIFDTFILFNTRKILEYGMLIPKILKENNVFVDEIQKKLWPELDLLKHPNITRYSETLVDWYEYNLSKNILFFNDSFHEKTYEIRSGNMNKELQNKKVPFYEKPNTCGIVFGFANNVLSPGDFVDLDISVKLSKANYYLDVTVLCCWNQLCNDGGVRYGVYLDDKRLFVLPTNTFMRPNQIVYMFQNSEARDAVIKIRLYAGATAAFKNFNGLIDIKHVLLMTMPSLKEPEQVSSTYELYAKSL